MGQKLQCYARGLPGDWEGICVDLDIAVQGVSFEEVQSLLGEAIKSYVEDARAEAPDTARRLLNRRAPLGVRLGMAVGVLAHMVLRGRKDQEYQANFELPCHA